MALLGILLVVLLNTIQSATALWRGSENRMEAYREARAALHVMSSDLAGFAPSTNTAHFRTNVSADNQLAFIALLPQSSQADGDYGDVCAVGYFLGYGSKSPIGTGESQAYNLYRYFLGSNGTFSSLSSGSDLFPDNEFGPGQDNSEILARNVINFSVTGLATSASGFTHWTQSPDDPSPDLLEIKITALNNERASRLQTQAEWDAYRTDTNAPDFLKNTKTFIKRIKLNAQ